MNIPQAIQAALAANKVTVQELAYARDIVRRVNEGLNTESIREYLESKTHTRETSDASLALLDFICAVNTLVDNDTRVAPLGYIIREEPLPFE
jgi:hypothetical protein